MTDPESSSSPDGRDRFWLVVGTLFVVVTALIAAGVQRWGAQETFVWVAVALAATALIGAILGCLHLARALRTGGEELRVNVSIALVSGLLIGLAVWVPQQYLKGKLDELIDRGKAEQVEETDNLNGAELKDIPLEGAQLAEKTLDDAMLAGGQLGGANLAGSSLVATDLTAADASGANLNDAVLVDAELGGADLTGANLAGVDATGANFTEADLTGADLTGAVLANAELSGTQLQGADLREAVITGDLSMAELDGATICPDGEKAALVKGSSEEFGCKFTDLEEPFTLCSSLLDEPCPSTNVSDADESPNNSRIPERYTCDRADGTTDAAVERPSVSWKNAPNDPPAAEIVLALTRGREVLWLEVAARPESEGKAWPDENGDWSENDATTVKTFQPVCPTKQIPNEQEDSEGDVNREPTTAASSDPENETESSDDGLVDAPETYTLTLYFIVSPLPRDQAGTILGSTDEIIVKAEEGTLARASVVTQYTRTSSS